MNIVLIRPDEHKAWLKALHRYVPDAEVFIWGEDDIDPDVIDYALVWKPEPGVLKQFFNLKGICNLGAGVDHLLADETFPKDIPLVRLVDPKLSAGMVEYLVHWVLHFHRDFHIYARQQRDKVWLPHLNADTMKRSVGILGLGELGQDCAHALMMLGFETIHGWSRSEKELPGIKSYYGNDQLSAFLKNSDILINLLPATRDTRHILNHDTLNDLPNHAFIINAGRGATINEAELIEHLQNRTIAGAALDVMESEPLSDDHPFWTMENVFITPHIASLTNPNSAALVLAEALRAWEAGETPENLVDMEQGY